jgi:hypothetical protein
MINTLFKIFSSGAAAIVFLAPFIEKKKVNLSPLEWGRPATGEQGKMKRTGAACKKGKKVFLLTKSPRKSISLSFLPLNHSWKPK